MNLRLIFLLFLPAVPLIQARAVEEDVNGVDGFNVSVPTSGDIPNWDTGWAETGISGWNYVGTVNDGSGVYLGNNWVITAGHVGAGPFTLNGTSYEMAPGSAQVITDSLGTADLTLFQLTLAPNLPALTIATNPPFSLSWHDPGSQVAMIGYGSGSETWGLNTVTAANVTVEVIGYSYETTDFQTAYGTTSDGNQSVTNNAVLIGGDSGGGDFIYNSAAGTWTLAGINEAVDLSNADSYMVQLSAYASQIHALTAVPEPGDFLLTGMGLAVLAGYRCTRRGLPV